MADTQFLDPYLSAVPQMPIQQKAAKKKLLPKINQLKSAELPLEPFCSYADGADYIQITQWSNFEGFDIMIESKTRGLQQFALTYGEVQALIHLYTGMSRL